MRRAVRDSRNFVPLAVFAASLMLTAIACGLLMVTLRERDRARFENAVQAAQDRIESRLETYVAMLRGAAGLFAAHDGFVSRSQFNAFVERLNVAEQYPGIQGIGFSKRVPATQSAQFVEAMREETSPNFDIWPQSDASAYFPIIYLEPYDARNEAAVGFDMYSEPVRRQAMERAWRAGAPALSGKVTLKQEIEGPKQAGFLVYVPVYRGGGVPNSVEDRLQLLEGFVYAPFRADDLFGGIFGREVDPRVSFRVYAGDSPDAQRLLHDAASRGLEPEAPRFVHEARLSIAGQPWTITFASLPRFEEASPRSLVPGIGLAGVLISLALFSLTRAQTDARREAEQSAEEARSSSKLLDAERARLSSLFMAAPAAIALTRGPEHVYVLSNATNNEWIGHRDVLGKPVREALPELAAGGFVALLDRVYQTGEPFSGTETPLKVAQLDGTTRDLFINFIYQPTRGADGAIDGVAGFAFDVTAQVVARQKLEALTRELRASEEHYRYTVELNPQVPWTARPDGYISDFSDRWLQLTGMTRQEAVGRGWTRAAHQEDIPAMYEAWSRATATGEPYDVEHRIRMADGSYRWMRSHAEARRDADGRIIQWYGTTEDIHERREAEDRQRLQAAELQKAIEARDIFLSVASHELKTPLTPLALRLGVVKSGMRAIGGEDGFSGLLANVEIAEAQVRKLAGLIEGLLDVSRLSQGRLPLYPEELDVAQIIRETAQAMAPQAHRAGSKLVIDAPGELVGRFDRMRLGQVAANLISNAIKFGAGGPIHVAVSQRAGGVYLVVKDEGIGIPPENIERIFQRFERGVSERNYGGLGLGLYVTREIVEAMGGTIRAEAGIPRGAVFIVELPLQLDVGADPRH